MRRTDLLRPLLTLTVLLVLAGAGISAQHIAAQDDDTHLPEGVIFQPIDAIIDSELEVTNFANDGTATLPIETSVPVACSIVYGPTPEFGSLSVDMDMEGGAHTEHRPLLSGLEPETTYYYRVQGVDAEGVIYLSDVMTFTTPPRSEEPITNLASPELGAEIIGVSSAFGGAGFDDTWGAGSAFDGNPNTAWSSAGDGDDAWIEVRLAQRSHITGVEFWTRFMSDGSARITSFTVTTDSGKTFGPFALPDAEQAYTFEVDIEAETLRFDVESSTGGNTGAVDIAVYGEPIAD